MRNSVPCQPGAQDKSQPLCLEGKGSGLPGFRSPSGASGRPSAPPGRGAPSSNPVPSERSQGHNGVQADTGLPRDSLDVLVTVASAWPPGLSSRSDAWFHLQVHHHLKIMLPGAWPRKRRENKVHLRRWGDSVPLCLEVSWPDRLLLTLLMIDQRTVITVAMVTMNRIPKCPARSQSDLSKRLSV